MTKLTSDERLLFLAAVCQAMVDATQPKGKNQESARRTIFASYDTTATHFELLCTYAGLDASYVQRITKKFIDEGKVLPPETVKVALRLGSMQEDDDVEAER